MNQEPRLAVLTGTNSMALAALLAASASAAPIKIMEHDWELQPFDHPETIRDSRPIVLGNSPRVHRTADPAVKSKRKAQRAARRKSR